MLFMRIGFGSTIKLVSFDESQVVTLKGKFVCGFKNSDRETESRSDNTVDSPHGFIIHWIVILKNIKKMTEVIDVENWPIDNSRVLKWIVSLIVRIMKIHTKDSVTPETLPISKLDCVLSQDWIAFCLKIGLCFVSRLDCVLSQDLIAFCPQDFRFLSTFEDLPLAFGRKKLWETLAEGDEGALHLGPKRPRVYSDLSPEDKDNKVTIQRGCGKDAKGNILFLLLFSLDGACLAVQKEISENFARPDNDDINLSFSREESTSSSWSQVGIVIVILNAAAAPTHSAFIGAASSGSKPTYSDQQSVVPSVSQTSGRSDNIMECVLHSFVAENEPDQDMIYEDFDQVDQFGMEELDLNWQNVAMLSFMINKNKTGEVEKVYGMMAGLHADKVCWCFSNAADEFAMMGISPKAYQHAVKTLESQKDWYHKTQMH
ncbi:hypothetical protein Tco_0003132 [Tanacetum coccineum]